MDVAQTTAVHRAITAAGLAGAPETDLLQLFCQTLVRKGLPLSRATVVIDTLHPVHEGRAFRWHRDHTQLPPVVESGRTHSGGRAQENW